jgi:hypothetical protein
MKRLKMKRLWFLTVSVFCLLCLVGTQGFADEVSVQSTWIPGPSTPPIINGTITAGEWAGAGSVPILVGLSPVGYVLVKNDTSTLYMILDITDDTGDEAVPMEDFFRLTVDVKADANIEPNVDVQFMMDSSADLGIQYYLGPGSYTALSSPAANSQVGVGFGASPILSSPSHRMWELAIGFEDIGIEPEIWTSGSAAVIRVGVRLISTNPSFNIAFPASYETDFSELITIFLGHPSIPVDPSAPGLKGVGHIPRSNIIDGYADTSIESDPILRVKDAPFGGTIDVKGDFAALKVNGAVEYKIEYSKDGGPYQAFTQTWTNYRWGWDGSKFTYIANTIEPDVFDKYDCLPDPLNDWYWNDLVMRWKTHPFGNGLYTLRITAYDSGGGVISSVSGTTLTLVIDNTPPQVEIKAVYHYKGGSLIDTLSDCGVVTVEASDTTDGLKFRIMAIESDGHLKNYRMPVYYADNQDMAGIPKDYYFKYQPLPLLSDPRHVDEDGPHLWKGKLNYVYPEAGDPLWRPNINPPYLGEVCGYQFRLAATSRTINGYYEIHYREYNRHVCIEVQ